MPTYKAIRGPAADYELVTPGVQIPGMDLRIECGKGPLLILAQITIWNSSGVTFQPTFYAGRTGSTEPSRIWPPPIPNNTGLTCVGHFLYNPAPGVQHFFLIGTGTANAGETVQQRASQLIVIELPELVQPEQVLDL